MRDNQRQSVAHAAEAPSDGFDGPHDQYDSREGSLALNDAISLMSYAARHPETNVGVVRELVDAGATLLAHVRELERALARERARWAAASEQEREARVEGGPLIEGCDAGGARHHLRGVPVHAGDALWLLTAAGWLEGRYEWEFRAGTPPHSFSRCLVLTSRSRSRCHQGP